MNRNKREGFIPVILIAVLALVVAAGGVGIGLAWKTDLLDKWLPNNVKEFFGKEITPTDGEPTNGGTTDGGTTNGEEDPTKDWKTYTDASLGISLKYPPNWSIDAVGSFSSPDITYNELESSLATGTALSITVEDLGGKKLDDWVAEFPFGHTIRKETDVDGYRAVQINVEFGANGGPGIRTYVAVGGKMYLVVCGYAKSAGSTGREECGRILDLVLSTVRFL